ncbi:MAG: hypothetical protein C0504_11025 [Candidatus Solibacter sp.]|nr:hypothetical protein [Candidatus Solibacter sp.]
MPRKKAAGAAGGSGGGGQARGSIGRQMLRSLVTGRLLERLQAGEAGPFEAIVALNENFPGGTTAAGDALRQWLTGKGDLDAARIRALSSNVICVLDSRQLVELSRWHYGLAGKAGASPVYRIWEDGLIEPLLTRSAATVKADAAHRAFSALGEGVVWAVVDSGIDGRHPHFASDVEGIGRIRSLELPAPVEHIDYTGSAGGALSDETGHGTHVAGIIAGAWQAKRGRTKRVAGVMTLHEGEAEPRISLAEVERICGIAPLAKLVSMKVVAGAAGRVSSVLAALDQIQRWNEFGRNVRVQGVNLSVGYPFNPEWFGCGHSPVCVEVNRLVKSGVVVVAASGNSGYTTWVDMNDRVEAGFSSRSITDPGNAELAITVGSTHRDMPHTYGVSYFSSRGPTGDGRLKPDLIAPGERILSCAAGAEKARYGNGALYSEQSGTSAAAPHVSGAVAAFLSVRREFIGQPEKVKSIFAGSAMDIQRDPYSQGRGLLDLNKALQSV